MGSPFPLFYRFVPAALVFLARAAGILSPRPAVSARPGPRREAGHSSDTPEKRLRNVSSSRATVLFGKSFRSVCNTLAHIPFQKRWRRVLFHEV